MAQKTIALTLTSSWLSWFLLASLISGCAAGTVPQSELAGAADPLETRDAAWFAEQGQQAAQRGDSVRAEQYLATALRRGHDRRRVLPLLMRVCIGSLRLRTALSYAEPELTREPRDTELRLLVATIRMALGQHGGARSELESVIYYEPRQAEAYFLLGVLAAEHLDEGGFAQTQLAKYLELEPKGPRALEARHRLAELKLRALPPPQKVSLEASPSEAP